MKADDGYESHIWHDNHIHGFAIQEGEDGTGELILDIDHIQEWLPPTEGTYSFKVAPAHLVFHEVSDLVVSIDYASTPAAIQPMSIAKIVREEIIYPNGYKSFKWRIEINWPRGEIAFKGSGFSLSIRAQPVHSESQVLSAEQRQAMLAPNKSSQPTR